MNQSKDSNTAQSLPEYDFIENIQEAIIDAKGRLFKREELLNMTLRELSGITVPNSIRIIAKYKSTYYA